MIKFDLIIPIGLFYMGYNILFNNEFWGRGGGYIKFEQTIFSISMGVVFCIFGILYLVYMYKSKKSKKQITKVIRGQFTSNPGTVY